MPQIELNSMNLATIAVALQRLIDETENEVENGKVETWLAEDQHALLSEAYATLRIINQALTN